MNNAVQTLHPYLVGTDDSLTFWCWHDLETNYDVAVVEVSENTREWFNLDTTRFNGNSNGWIRRAYSLENWIGKSVYIRFRAMTDGSVLEQGFYVDDIYPTPYFTDVDTVSSSIADTLYDFVGHQSGEYYYSVRGYNATYGWGDYSCLEKVGVSVGIDQGDICGPARVRPSLSLEQNPFADQLHIVFTLGNSDADAARLCIYNATGQLVKSFPLKHYAVRSTLSWDGRDEWNKSVPNGVYFVKLETEKGSFVKKAVLLR
jgi:hypothetical protein